MSDRPAPAHRGIVPEQIAEIIVGLDGEAGRRGSGYRVGPTAVLTAAHIVEGAVSVRVRFDADLPGEWSAEAISCWTDPRSDFAIVTIARAELPAAIARFGRIGGDRAAVLAVHAVGFPRFKLKTDDGNRSVYRDSHQAVGSVAVLSNRREGTLEVTVPPPERDPDPAVSPWEGMSGAAVWVGDRIFGVIAKHHRCDGLGRLAATRLDLAREGLEASRREELRALIDLADVLPDVVPSSVGKRVATAYQAQVRDIAPDRLLDREEELDNLVKFCAGDQPYAWWQAGPWAGKSALMAWFVLSPPVSVDVVSFFVTARLAGQSDSDACTDALIEQLAALVGESPAGLLTAGARRGTMLRLLDDAASRSREAGRRLLLVIDGLDEDSGTGLSVAALLPRRPPPEVRVLVASRPHPPIPDDVADDHPLRMITPRQLAVSEHGRGVERLAKLELAKLLIGSPLQRDVLGLITAAGGGLTLGDLTELAEQPPFAIRHLLGGVFGRSVGSRIGTLSAGYPDERVYLFTHETLRLVAEQQYGKSLAAYRDRLHSWAGTYRHLGWPAETPHYLLRSYPRMLASSGDLTRLVACATDQARHDRLRELTGGDALAFTEIGTAQQLILALAIPDLTSLALPAVQRGHLTDRNSNIPLELPAMWARIGQPARAEALANSIPSPDRRARALARLAEAVAATGDADRATQLTNQADTLTTQITDPDRRARALARLARAFAVTGDADRATQLTNQADTLTTQITDPDRRARALARLASAFAVTGDPDRAETLTGQIANPHRRAEALAGVAKAVAATGNHDRAARLTSEADMLTELITELDLRVEALARLAGVAVSNGDHDRAARLTREAETLTGQITDPYRKVEALIRVAKAVATTGDHDRAEALTGQITNPHRRAEALTQVSKAVVTTGDHDRAARLTDEADTLTGQVSNPHRRADALARVAEAVATTGDLDRATRLTGEAAAFTAQITNPYLLAEVLARLAKVVVAGGDHDRAARLTDKAEKLTALIINPHRRAEALAQLAEAVVAGGDRDRAARLTEEAAALTGQTVNPYLRAEVLARLAGVAVADGDHDRAARLTGEAETLTAQITEADLRAELLARLATILVETSNETSPAPEHAPSSSPPMTRARHLLAAALVTGSWPKIVSGLARVDSAAINALADELLMRWGRDFADDCCR